VNPNYAPTPTPVPRDRRGAAEGFKNIAAEFLLATLTVVLLAAVGLSLLTFLES
jgi:hypothetical protein